MADTPVTIRVTFKAGPAQLKNLEQEYQIASSELDRLVTEIRAIDATRRPTHPFGVYDVMRSDGGVQVQTRLILRFDDVLFIG